MSAREQTATGGRAATRAQTLNVAVLAGGRSSEHEISLASGASVRDGLLAGGHRVVWVEIGRDGAWRVDGERISVTPGAGLLDVDVVFPALHGPFGEDGSVQGLLEMLDVAYVGAGVAASALCIDKVRFKDVMATVGIPQVRYAGVPARRFARHREEVLGELERLGLPVFVKPAHLGSSVGIVKVSERALLAPALESAFAYDGLVIVEAMAGGLEVECGVLGELARDGAGGAMASVPGQIETAADWYDFDAKYAPGGMRLLVPAGISPRAAELVRDLAVRAFSAVGCEGLARVDFFVDGEEVLVNELNTIPGFTPTSVYGKLMEASGIPYPELVERLCRLALQRQRERRAYSY
jgi:D-alanine-D-alanine ligase